MTVARSASAGDSVYFSFVVEPSSDFTTESYYAALELFEGPTGERVGVGNAFGAFAYSAVCVEGSPSLRWI